MTMKFRGLLVLVLVGVVLGFGVNAAKLVAARKAPKKTNDSSVMHMSTNSGLILTLTPGVNSVKVEGSLDALQTSPFDERYYWFVRINTADTEELVMDKEYQHQAFNVAANVQADPMTFADSFELLPGRYFVHLGIRDSQVRHDEHGNVARKPAIRGKGNYVVVP